MRPKRKKQVKEEYIQRTKEDHHKKGEKSGCINKTNTTIPQSSTKCIGQKRQKQKTEMQP